MTRSGDVGMFGIIGTKVDGTGVVILTRRRIAVHGLGIR